MGSGIGSKIAGKVSGAYSSVNNHVRLSKKDFHATLKTGQGQDKLHKLQNKVAQFDDNANVVGAKRSGHHAKKHFKTGVHYFLKDCFGKRFANRIVSKKTVNESTFVSLSERKYAKCTTQLEKRTVLKVIQTTYREAAAGKSELLGRLDAIFNRHMKDNLPHFKTNDKTEEFKGTTITNKIPTKSLSDNIKGNQVKALVNELVNAYDNYGNNNANNVNNTNNNNTQNSQNQMKNELEAAGLGKVYEGFLAVDIK